jgi:hypothetical protein
MTQDEDWEAVQQRQREATDKASAWSDADRAKTVTTATADPELTGQDIEPGRALTPEERAALPPWAEVLRPGRAIIAAGWVTRVMLIDPSRDMLMLHVEGQTQSAEKRQARALRGLKPKHVQRRQRRAGRK